MPRSNRWLAIAVGALMACSDGADKPRGTVAAEGDATDAATPDTPAPIQSESFSRGTVFMRIVAKVADKTYVAKGMGECASSADASIYEVPATLWHAMYDGGTDPRSLNLTIWRPRAGGGDMVGLSILIGDATHKISTVKGGSIAGSGTPKVQPAGQGGALSVTGVDEHGDAIELSVTCQRFDEVVAEGG